MADEVPPPDGRLSAIRVSLTFGIDRDARLEGLIGDGGQGYSRPGRTDRVARRVDGSYGTATRIGIERTDHVTVVATAERDSEAEPWGWAECRLAVDVVMADLCRAGLVPPLEGLPYVGGDALRLASMRYDLALPGADARDAALAPLAGETRALVPALDGVAEFASSADGGRAVFDAVLDPAAPLGAWVAARAVVDLVHEHLYRLGLDRDDIGELRAWADGREAILREGSRREEPAVQLELG